MPSPIHNLSIHKPRKQVAVFVLLCFVLNTIIYPAGAQVLPAAETVTLSAGFRPPVLLGLKIHTENPLLFDFIVDPGQSQLSQIELKNETEKLVKYFLAALTIPDKEVWVNLSPTEKDRIVPDVLGQTIMGKTMLEQDYLLKQLASSLTNPETELGKKYWENTKKDPGAPSFMNKVWIVPQTAEILESQNIVLIGEKKLKVMMAEEYEKTKTTVNESFRRIILPLIEKEVNEGRNFAQVRQIYNSVILAAWYKKTLKESLLGRVYADQAKIAGVETDDKEMKERIYKQYLEAFKKGAYNFIKEESDTATGEMIPRKYFSGGAVFDVGNTIRRKPVSSAVVANTIAASSSISATVRLTEQEEKDAVGSSSIFSLPKDLRSSKPLDVSKLKEVRIAEKGLKGLYRVFVDPAQPEVIYHVGHDDGYAWEHLENELRVYGVFFHLLQADFEVVPSVLEYGNVQRPEGQSIFKRKTAPYIKFRIPLGSERLSLQSEIWQSMNLNEQLAAFSRLAEMYAAIHGEQILHGNVDINNILIASDQDGNPRLRITNFTNAQSIEDAKVSPEIERTIGNPLQVEIHDFEVMLRYALTEKVKREVNDWPEFLDVVGLKPIFDDAINASRTGDRYSSMWQVMEDLFDIEEKLLQLQNDGIVPERKGRKDIASEFSRTMEKVMQKPLRVGRASSGMVQHEVFIRASRDIYAQEIRKLIDVSKLSPNDKEKQEQDDFMHDMVVLFYKNLLYRVLDHPQKWSTEQILSNIPEVSDIWINAVRSSRQWTMEKGRGILAEPLEQLKELGITGEKKFDDRVKGLLIGSLTPDFLDRVREDLKPKDQAGSTPLVDDGQLSENDLIENALQKIWDTYILGNPENTNPVYYNASANASFLSRADLSTTRTLLENFGFKRDPEKEVMSADAFGMGSSEFYGYPMPDGHWANYEELRVVMAQQGIDMPPATASTPLIANLAGETAGRILTQYDAVAKADMQYYENKLRGMGLIPTVISRDDIAKQFVRAIILKMAEMQTTKFSKLGPQQWQEVADYLGRSPEAIQPPGDFINQLTIFNAQSNPYELLSNRTFHPEFIRLVQEAMVEILTLQKEIFTHRIKIYGILSGSREDAKEAIMALNSFVIGSINEIPQQHQSFLAENKLLIDGKVPQSVVLALQSFILPSDGRASSSLEELRTEIDRLKNIYGLELDNKKSKTTKQASIQVWSNPWTKITYTLVMVFNDSAKGVSFDFGILDGDFGGFSASDIVKILKSAKYQNTIVQLGVGEIEWSAPEKNLDGDLVVDDNISPSTISTRTGRVGNMNVTYVSDKQKGMSVVVPIAVRTEQQAQVLLDSTRLITKKLVSDTVHIKYIGMVRIANRWVELTQIIKQGRTPQEGVLVAYLEGNMTNRDLDGWLKIDSLKLDEVDDEAFRETAHGMNVENFQAKFRRLTNMNRQEVATQFRIAFPPLSTPTSSLPRDINNKYKSFLASLTAFNLPAALFYEVLPDERLAMDPILRREQFVRMQALWEELNVENQLTVEEQLVLDELVSKENLGEYLTGLDRTELFRLAAIVLKAPHHEEYITLTQWMAFKTKTGITDHLLQLIIWKYIYKYRDGENDDQKALHLADVMDLELKLRRIMDAVAVNAVTQAVAGPRFAELEQMEVVLNDIISPSISVAIVVDMDDLVLDIQKEIYNIEYEVSRVKLIASKKPEVQDGSLKAGPLADLLTIWLRDLTNDDDHKLVSPELIVDQMVELVNLIDQNDPSAKAMIVRQIADNADRAVIDPKSAAYKYFIRNVAPERASGEASSALEKDLGGIDFDTSSLNLQIKRDGQGVPLPLMQQNLKDIHIDGLFPVIINMTPLNSQTLPLFIDAQGAL